MRSLLQKHLGAISIFIAVSSLVCHILSAFKPSLEYCMLGESATLYDISSIVFSKILNQYPKFSILSIVFYIMMLVGGFVYIRSKNKDARLLMFAFLVIFVQKVVGIFSLPLFSKMKNLPSYLERNDFYTSNIFLYGNLLSSVFFGFISYYVLSSLLRNRTIYEEYTPSAIFSASKLSRFAHLFFDFLLSMIIVSPIVFSLIYFFKEDVSRSKAILYPIYLISTIIYFLLTEGIFGVSPIKCLTGTKVIDIDTGEKPGFGLMMARTMTRFIPFEAFSFLGTKPGWHDRLSNTLVVKTGEQKTKLHHVVWWLLLFIVYGGLFGMQYYNSSQTESLSQQLNEKTNRLINENIKKLNSEHEALIIKCGGVIRKGSFGFSNQISVIEQKDSEININVSVLNFRAEIISIKTLKGNIKWENKLPLNGTYYDSEKMKDLYGTQKLTDFNIYAKDVDIDQIYEAEMIVRVNNHDYKVLILGFDMKVNFIEIK